MAQVYKRAGKNGKADRHIRCRDPSGRDIRKATSAMTQRAANPIPTQALREIGDDIVEKNQWGR